MTKKEPAFGRIDKGPFDEGTRLPQYECGLTKRELFAAMAMQGIISSVPDSLLPADVAEWSKEFADALIERLVLAAEGAGRKEQDPDAAEDAPVEAAQMKGPRLTDDEIVASARIQIEKDGKLQLKKFAFSVGKSELQTGILLCEHDLREELPDSWQQKPKGKRGKAYRARMLMVSEMAANGLSPTEMAAQSGGSQAHYSCMILRWKALQRIFGDKA